MGGQNKIKKGCKYGKLFITLEGSRNFKSMQYEMGKAANIITIKCGNWIQVLLRPPADIWR